MKLSPNFSLAEFETSQTAARRGIDNTVPQRYIPRLKALCRSVLQPLRDHLGRPVVVTSGYRCLLLNTAIGGSEHSQHIYGEAADIIVPGLAIPDLFETIIELDLPYDQVINEFGKWVHISHRANRHEELRARKAGGQVYYTFA